MKMVTIYLLDGESLTFREAKEIETMTTDGVSFLGFVAHKSAMYSQRADVLAGRYKNEY